MKRSLADLNLDELTQLYKYITLEILKIKFDIKLLDIENKTNLKSADLTKAKRPRNYSISRQKMRKTIQTIYENFKEEITPHIQDQYDLQANSSGERYFVYYFLNKEYRIELAIMTISYHEGNVELKFFVDNPDYKDGKNSTEDKKVLRSKYFGKVIKPSEGGELFIQYERRIINQSEINIPSLNCFYGGTGGFDNDIMIGVFLGTGRSCGLLAIEKVNNAEIAWEKVNNTYIKPLIHTILYNKRIAPERDLPTSSSSTAQQLIQFLDKKNISGVYEGYVLESRQNRECIHKIICEIKKNGQFKFNSQISDENKGFIVEKFHGNLLGKFQFNKESGQYRMQIILDTLDFVPQREDYLIGVYSGIETDNKPMAGRMIFFKTDKKYAELRPKIYYLKYEHIIQDLLEKQPKLKQFIRGELDSYVDSPIILEKHRLLLANEKIQSNQEIRNYAGTYMTYQLEDKERSIIAYPLEILLDGQVKIKKSGKAICTGQANYAAGLLSVFINKFEMNGIEKDHFEHYLYYVGMTSNDELHHYHGVSSCCSVNISPRAGREVLIGQDAKFEALDVQKIPFPVLGADVNLFNNLEMKYPNLGHFLTGNANNLIKSKREVDASFERNEDYGMLYFSSACFYAERSNSKEALIQLERAFLHGFQDKNLLKEELKKGLGQQGIKEKIDIEHLIIL